VPSERLPVTRPGGPFQQPPLTSQRSGPGQVGGRTSSPTSCRSRRSSLPACWDASRRRSGSCCGRMARGGLSIDVAHQCARGEGPRPLVWPSRTWWRCRATPQASSPAASIPIPVPGGLGTVPIDYKKYGVGLAFTPTVLQGRADQSQDRAGGERARPQPSGPDRAATRFRR
jgi:pilus assembly protein CpaC